MKTTIAGARGNRHATQHCSSGHEFTVGTAYEDAHGEWCPECGNGAHSGPAKDCALCAMLANPPLCPSGRHYANRCSGGCAHV